MSFLEEWRRSRNVARKPNMEQLMLNFHDGSQRNNEIHGKENTISWPGFVVVGSVQFSTRTMDKNTKNKKIAHHRVWCTLQTTLNERALTDIANVGCSIFKEKILMFTCTWYIHTYKQRSLFFKPSSWTHTHIHIFKPICVVVTPFITTQGEQNNIHINIYTRHHTYWLCKLFFSMCPSNKTAILHRYLPAPDAVGHQIHLRQTTCIWNVKTKNQPFRSKNPNPRRSGVTKNTNRRKQSPCYWVLPTRLFSDGVFHLDTRIDLDEVVPVTPFKKEQKDLFSITCQRSHTRPNETTSRLSKASFTSSHIFPTSKK